MSNKVCQYCDKEVTDNVGSCCNPTCDAVFHANCPHSGKCKKCDDHIIIVKRKVFSSGLLFSNICRIISTIVLIILGIYTPQRFIFAHFLHECEKRVGAEIIGVLISLMISFFYVIFLLLWSFPSDKDKVQYVKFMNNNIYHKFMIHNAIDNFSTFHLVTFAVILLMIAVVIFITHVIGLAVQYYLFNTHYIFIGKITFFTGICTYLSICFLILVGCIFVTLCQCMYSISTVEQNYFVKKLK
jgi:hypothetical protein